MSLMGQSGGIRVDRHLARDLKGIRDQAEASDYYDLLDVWLETTDSEKREQLGGFFLGLLKKAKNSSSLKPKERFFIEHEFLVAKTLSFIGTPICTCDTELKLEAIDAFLSDELPYSVRFAAVRALHRLAFRSSDTNSSNVPFNEAARLLQQCEDLKGCQNEDIESKISELASLFNMEQGHDLTKAI